ncbi:MAG: hypothetical protein IKJ88_04160 [Clostridia bacterium]|nr:hypothetical protein [Clostridia bacterium]
MIFLEKINHLIKSYNSNMYKPMDEAVLYGLYDKTPPLAEHIIFNPMPADVMQNMVNNYKRTFPEQLLTIYRAMNGANLFWSTCLIRDIKIPMSYFSIYAIPLTYDRRHIEPFNISIEDLNRPKNTPDSWLKFGSFYKPKNFSDRFDLFVDTDNGCVFSVDHDAEKCDTIESWNTVDECLCYIFDLLNEAEL